jgi:hypothetical protein
VDIWGMSFCHCTFQKKCVPAKRDGIGKEKLFVQVSNEVREFPLTLLLVINITGEGVKEENNGLPRNSYAFNFNNFPWAHLPVKFFIVKNAFLNYVRYN